MRSLVNFAGACPATKVANEASIQRVSSKTPLPDLQQRGKLSDVFRKQKRPDKSGRPGKQRASYSTALTMSSMTFFASPKTIMVLSR